MSIDASLPWTPKAHLRFHQKLCEQLPKKFIRNPEKYLNKHIKTPESPWPWGDLTQHSSIKWSRLFCRLFPREHRFGGVEHLFAYFCNTYLPTILPSPGMKTSHTAWFNNQLSDVTSRRVRAVALSKLRWIEKQEYFSPYAIREILEKSHPPASSDLPAPPLPLPVTPHQVSHKWTEVHSEKLYRIIAERLPHLSKDPKKAINTYLERAKVYQWPWNARFGRYCVIWSKIASEEFFEERFTAEKLEKKFHNKVFREKFLKEPPLTFTNEHQEWLRQYVEKHGKTAWKEASIAFFQQYQYYVSDKELLQLHEKSEPSPVSNDLASAAAPVVSLELPVEQDRLPVPPHSPVASQQNITSPPDELTDEIQPSSDEQRTSSQWKPHQVSHKWTEVHSEKLYRIIAERLPHLSKDPKKAINTYLERAKVYQWPWNARFGRYRVIWSKIASEKFFEERFTAEKLEKKFLNKVFRKKFLQEPPLTFTNKHQEWLRQYVEKHGKTAWKEASIAFFQQYQYYVSDKELLQLHEKSEPSPVSNDLASAAAPVVSLELPVEQDRLPVPPYLPVASHLLVASHLPVASQQNITSPPDELTDEIQPSSDEQRISSQWKPHHEQLLIKSINAVLPRFAANPKSAIGESITLRKEWPWKAVRWMKIAEKFSRDISDVSKLSKYIRQHFEDVTVPVILSQANQTRPPHITKAINDLLLIRPAYQISEIAHCIFQQHEWYMSPNSVRNIRNSIRQRHRLPASKRKSSSLEEPPSKIPRTAAASPTQGRPATPPEYVEERDSPFSLDSFDSLPSLSSADVVSQFFK